MRLPIVATALLLAIVAPNALAAQPTESTPDPKVDSTTPPPVAPGTCIDRNRDRKCDKPEEKGERRLREAGEIAAPIAKSRVSRRKGGTRGAPSNVGGWRKP